GAAVAFGFADGVSVQAPGPSAEAAKAAAQAPTPVTSSPRTSAPARPAPAGADAAPGSIAEQNAIVKRYCAGCHNERRPASGLSLAGYNVADAASDAETAEKLIVKLQAGMMPPPGSTRPDEAQY